MGEIEIDLRLVFGIPESGLTINGLISGLKRAVGDIHGAILVNLLKAVEERAIDAVMRSEPGRYRRNGRQSKACKLRSSLGAVEYRFAQLRDEQSGRSVSPLVQALAIPAYAQYLEEALEPGIGLSMHVSYRRAQSEVGRMVGVSMSHTTVHRRLQELAGRHDPFGSLQGRGFRYLVVDGTKVHLQAARGQDLGQVEMRWALASVGPDQRFEPVGFWIDTGWPDIRKQLENRLDYEKLEVLFCDGGAGITQNLLHPAMRAQRCLWHGKREFPYFLYNDGFKKAEQRELVDQLNAVPIMSVVQADVERLRAEDRPYVEQMIDKSRECFQQLINALDPQRYPQTRTYIENLIEPAMTFLYHWLDKGEAIALTTNAIENAFSHVNNRIKRVGRRWSEQGLLNWLKVTFYKIFKPDLWNTLWNVDNDQPKIKLLTLQVSWRWLNAIT